jgi:hypothetical protein
LKLPVDLQTFPERRMPDQVALLRRELGKLELQVGRFPIKTETQNLLIYEADYGRAHQNLLGMPMLSSIDFLECLKPKRDYG